jgi:hypothetical protein
MPVKCARGTRPHRLGEVVSRSDQEHLVLRYKAAVRHGVTGNEREDFTGLNAEVSDGDGSDGVEAWCAGCRRRLPVPLDAVFTSARRGASAFRLQGRNGWAKWMP